MHASKEAYDVLRMHANEASVTVISDLDRLDRFDDLAHAVPIGSKYNIPCQAIA